MPPLSTSIQPMLTIVIPFFNEAENVANVLQEVIHSQPDAEIIAVDDGSTDATWSIICQQAGVIGLRLTQNCGQSAALVMGLRKARGVFCATMDGDGQNDPADFAKLLGAIEQGRADIAVGRRAKRYDSMSRKLASVVANSIRRTLLADGVSDTGCSLKVFPRQAVQELVAFNGQHRFMPAIFLKAGYTLCEVDVNHRPRLSGISKYTNWERAFRGLYDLFGVAWLLHRKIVYPEVEVHT